MNYDHMTSSFVMKKHLTLALFGSVFSNVKFLFYEAGQQATVSPIGPDELPPPYTAVIQGGVPMVTCRVCQAMIDISGKRDQHVVKCGQCNEATVSTAQCYFDPLLYSDLHLMNCFVILSQSAMPLQGKSMCGAHAIVC